MTLSYWGDEETAPAANLDDWKKQLGLAETFYGLKSGVLYGALSGMQVDGENIKLEAAVDAIRRKHGENAIIQGNTGNPEIGLEGAWKRKKEAKRNPEADVLSPRADQKWGSADRSAQAHSSADQNTAKQKNHEK